jgi:hypothetical protein
LEILVVGIKPGLLVGEGQVFSIGDKFFVLRQVQLVIFQMRGVLQQAAAPCHQGSNEHQPQPSGGA